MITLYLERTTFLPDRTLGLLATPRYVFHTLEDTVREKPGVPVEVWKVQDETAIPQGTYPLILDMSARFKCILPHILSVPGFTGIRVHAGNTDEDTSGCILLGMSVTGDNDLANSRRAVGLFMSEIEEYYDHNVCVQIQVGSASP